MAANNVDLNLLFAVIALQNHFIDQADLIAAFHDWSADKAKPLDHFLVARGALAEEERALVKVLVEKHLKKHGDDVRVTLGAVADAAARDALRSLDDPETRLSLSGLPPAAGYVLIETLMLPSEQKRSRYTLTHLHAQGGLGRVWLARDSDLNREVALKEILPDQVPHPEVWRRFLKEAQITGQLEHPSIVPVYELSRRPEDDQPFYTMRFVRGQTLRQAIAAFHRRRAEGRADPLDQPKLLHAFVSVCQAIAYAHSRGVIHRDLKPDNVVLGGFGEVIVLDWGLAKMVDRPDEDHQHPRVVISEEAQSDATRAGHQLGTPAYMAPEQAEGRLDLVDDRTDIYGLGAILFEILTGRPPHSGKSVHQLLDQIVSGETPQARAAGSSVPAALAAICSKAMAKERSGRYAKAAELAEDVQRWLADEPVSAYPEPWTRRMARFGKRHRHALQLATALLIASVVSLVALARVEHAQRINRLVWELEKGLESADWTPARLEGLEGKSKALERLDRVQGLDARQRIHQAFARAVNDLMDRSPRLEPAVVGRIEGDLKLLEARSPELAHALRRNLELRLARGETTVLSPPFRDDAVGLFFDPGQVRIEGDGLARRPPSGDRFEPLLAMRLASPGDSRLAVTYQESWSAAPAVGLTLEARDGGRYQFLVSVPGSSGPGPEGSSSPSTTMNMVRQAGGRLRIAILRDKVVLAQGTIKAPDGHLRIEAAREGDELSFQVNAERPLVCEDPFPLGGGVTLRFGLYWPAEVKLQGMILRRQLLPGRPSPLERGDELYARGEFEAALASYQEQGRGSVEGSLGQQLGYKRALCLNQLGRADEAADQLRGVMTGLDTGSPGASTRWPLRAACQLWLLCIQQKKGQDADLILEKLAPSYSFEQLAVLIPARDRDAILACYQQAGIWGTVAFTPQDNLNEIERAIRVQDLLNSDDYERRMTKWRLVDMLRTAGDAEGALKNLRALLDDPALSPDERVELLRDFAWMRINQGEPGAREALDRVNLWLEGDRARPEYAPLLLERSRIEISLGRWPEAERDCERFFAEVPRDRLHYAEFADACLVRGFLRDHRGDLDGAAAAWNEGLLRRWAGGIPPLSPFRRLDRVALRRSGDAVTFGVMLASLVGDLTQAEADRFFDVMSGGNAFEPNQSDGEIIRFVRRLGIISRSIRQIMLDQYRAPRDRDFVRTMVFRRVSFRDYIVVPLQIGVCSGIRLGAFPEGVSAPIEEILRDAVNGLFRAYDDKTLNDKDLATLLQLWFSLTLSPANLWSSIAPRLDPHLRAALAVGFGRRYVVLGLPRGAAPFFQDAIDHAGEDQVLQNLARAELDRLKPAPGVPRP